MTRWMLLLGYAAGLWAQTQWTVPLAGIRRTPGGALFRVFGIAGNFVLEPHEAGSVQSAAFSGRAGLLKLDRSLALLDENGRVVCEQPAPEGPAIAAFDEHGRPAAILIPGAAETLCGIAAIEPTPGALAAAVRGGQLQLLLNRDDGLWLRAASGEERLDPRPAAAAAFAGSSVIYAAGEELILRDRDGATERISLPAPASDIAVMGEKWLAIQAGRLAFALRTGPASVSPLPSGEVRP